MNKTCPPFFFFLFSPELSSCLPALFYHATRGTWLHIPSDTLCTLPCSLRRLILLYSSSPPFPLPVLSSVPSPRPPYPLVSPPLCPSSPVPHSLVLLPPPFSLVPAFLFPLSSPVGGSPSWETLVPAHAGGDAGGIHVYILYNGVPEERLPGHVQQPCLPVLRWVHEGKEY